MASLDDLALMQEKTQEIILKMFKNSTIENVMHFPESPNPKLFIRITPNSTLELQMNYWSNNYCRCEAVDLCEMVMILEEELLMQSPKDAFDFMLKNLSIFHKYINR